MLLHKNLSINEKNHLTIGGYDTVELAKSYGTPLYVMDENLIRDNCRVYKNALDNYYGGNGLILYASKTFCTLAMCKIVKEEGMGLDVVSGGELYTAFKADFPMEKVYFHGNNKTEDELRQALSLGVGRIVVDNIFELELLNNLCGEMDKKADILFRIKPGIDAHTHDFIMTGQIDSKFGTAIETGEAFEIVKTASKMDYVNLVGLHCHIGSQIFDIAPFKSAAQVMLTFAAKLKNELGITIDELNLGGGFGIRYVESDDPVSYDEYIRIVSEVFKETSQALGINTPKVIMEPGRSIVGAAGITLYKIGAVKKIPSVRTYVTVDGGLADNPRYILYGSEYEFMLANNASAAKDQCVTVAGKCCESGDILGKDVFLPESKVGDIMAVLSTGAYNYSMSSNYNRIPRPAVVMIKDGEPRVVVKRETYDDLIKNDLL
ncbi:MAG: diaminopimelate decarboxylase [Ruminococcaceae bacterium]|nr:diaminopimelate decarboxylase [Oscillospiraceae bacterium]